MARRTAQPTGRSGQFLRKDAVVQPVLVCKAE